MNKITLLIMMALLLSSSSFGLITHAGDVTYYYNVSNSFDQDLNISSDVIFNNVSSTYFCFGASCLDSWSTITNNVTKFSDIYNDVGLGFGTSNYTYNVTKLSDFFDDSSFGTGTSNYTYNITKFSDIYNDFDGIMLTNLNMSGYIITDIGELLMSGIITSNDIIPKITGLYSIGNSTNWYAESYITNMYSDMINTTSLNTTSLESSDIATGTIDTDNMTLGGYEIKKVGDSLVMVI